MCFTTDTDTDILPVMLLDNALFTANSCLPPVAVVLLFVPTPIQ